VIGIELAIVEIEHQKENVMKNIYTLQQTLAILTLSLVISFCPTQISAQTYIAQNSGDWSDPLVWGYRHPDANSCEKTIIIPKGVSINLDKKIELGEQVELVINGKLKADEFILNLSHIDLMGNGRINVSELRADESSLYAFEGKVHVDKARLIDNEYAISSTFLVEEELILMNSTVDLNEGKLKLQNNAKLYMNSSEIDTINGKLVAVNKTYLYYIGDGGFTGPELRLKGIQSVNISLDNENASLMLSDHQSLKMDVIIKVGQLDLNGFNLTTYQMLVCEENGSIRGDQHSALALGGNSNLIFVKKNAVLKTLRVGAKNTEVELQTPLLVTQLVDLSYGKIDLNRNVLTVMGDLRISDFAQVKGNEKKWIKVIDELPVEEFFARQFVYEQ